MQFRTFLALIAGLAAFVPVAASAQLTPGTVLVGTMDTTLDSRSAQPGQPFTISNAHSTNYNVHNAVIYGHVASVQRAGQGTPAKITLAFDKVNAHTGNIYQVSGYASNVQVNTKSNALKEVGGAAAGALVGGLLGHGTGALIGAAGGALVAKNNRENVTIPAGSTVSVTIVRSRPQAR